MDPQRPEGTRETAEAISKEIAHIHRESYGRPPKDVKTYLLDDAVLCIAEMDLLRHEELIVDNGNGESVRAVRRAFQDAIGATFIATVEHMTGRRVIAFVSDTNVDPPFALEFFKLGRSAQPTSDEAEL